MRIGLIIYGSLDTFSGGYLYDRKLVAYLEAAGHDVEIVSLPWRRYLRHLGDNFSSELLDELAAKPFDLLLQDELNHPSLFLLNQKLRSRVSYPIISIVHHLRSSENYRAVPRSIYQLVEKRYLRSVDGFIFNSQTTKEAVEALAEESKPHVVAYPAGDRFDHYRKSLKNLRNSDPKFFNILFVGNIIPRKGLHVLIRAVEHLHLDIPNLMVEVVGDLNTDPFYALNMMRLVEDKHVEDHFQFLGRLNDDELAIRFTLNDLLVVPSQYEGFGIIYLEAMGFGMPVIGCFEGAAKEIIVDEETGFLIPMENDVELARYLMRLHMNQSMLPKMSERALERFEEFPTWQDTCEKIKQFLENF